MHDDDDDDEDDKGAAAVDAAGGMNFLSCKPKRGRDLEFEICFHPFEPFEKCVFAFNFLAFLCKFSL